MKARVGLFAALILAGLLGAALLQIELVSEGGAVLVPEEMPEPEYQAEELPRVESLRNPHAILVLDISGSMRESDPQQLQSEAVLRFYSIYSDLAREILRNGDRASLAIVLFSTVAQTVDWTGEGQPWLRVEDASTSLLERVVSRYLGSRGGLDPRAGQRTDYAAALERVKELTEALDSAPAVVFMTDGANEPDLLFSPALPLEERAAAWPAEYSRRRQEVESIALGKGRFISAVLLPKPIDPSERGSSTVARGASLVTADAAVRRVGEELRSRHYPLPSDQSGAVSVWAPVLLRGASDESATERARSLLAGSGDGSDVIICRDPRDLVGSFVDVLARWFRLREAPILPGSQRVSVPREAQAFALHVSTKLAGTAFALVSGQEVIELHGRDGVWAGVARRGGEWAFRTDGGEISEGRLLVRPRYEWILHSPKRMLIEGTGREVPVELHLVNLETEKSVAANQLIGRLPKTLSARAVFEGRTDVAFPLAAVQSSQAGSPAYTGRFPAGATLGSIAVEVDLSPLVAAGVPITESVARGRIELAPNIRPVFSGARGRLSAVRVVGVPREGAWLRGLLQGQERR